jgi:hypothetical protein
MANFIGTVGNDTQDGTNSADIFDYQQGGRDTLNGKGGNDLFVMGSELRANDRINGGGGTFDTVNINAAVYSVVFDDATLKNIEALQFNTGAYEITMADGNLAAGGHMSVLASAASSIVFDGSAETDGTFSIDTSSGDDVLTGGALGDTIGGGTPFFSPAGEDTIRGGGGDDTIVYWDDLNLGDRTYGGDGYDRMTLDGDYSFGLVFTNSTMKGIEELDLDITGGGFLYELTFAEGTVAAGATLTVDAQTASNVILDGTLETDGSFSLLGSAGGDVMAGGGRDDVITGRGGIDLVGGRGGNDLFVYPQASDSTGIVHDRVVEFNANADAFAVPVVITGIDAEVGKGTLNESNFDTRLANKIDGGRLGADHAVLYTPDAGDLAGITFLIVDFNATAGYQAGADLVLRLEAPVHLENLSVDNFFSL